jgi:hypothetical protein
MKMRALSVVVAGFTAGAAGATTLQQLSLNDLIVKSTIVVRAKVTGSYGAFRGPDVYTFYKLQISETLKPAAGQTTARIEVAVPGGLAQNVKQSVPGAPTLTIGGDYIFFLWTGPNTLTQILGLSQGLFQVTQDASGNPLITRQPATETMLDRNGASVADQKLTLRLSEVRAQIRKTLGAGI